MEQQPILNKYDELVERTKDKRVEYLENIKNLTIKTENKAIMYVLSTIFNPAFIEKRIEQMNSKDSTLVESFIVATPFKEESTF
jgi:hypothetical protein